MEPVEEEKELHPAVALLLKRMDSNPQEFLAHEWASAEEAIAAYATDEEKKLVAEKLGKLWMDHTHEVMLKHLFKVDEDDQDFTTKNTKFKTYERYSSGYTDPRDQYQHVQVGSSIYAQELAAQAQYKQMAAQALGAQSNAFQYDMEQNVIKAMQDFTPSGASAPKRPYLGQILRGPRPLSILKGFFKGRA